MAENPNVVGGPFTDLLRLAAALRQRNWPEAFKLLLGILQGLADDWQNPTIIGSQGVAGAITPATADEIATQIEQCCQPQPAGGPQVSGAVPWALIIPILVQALQAILRRS